MPPVTSPWRSRSRSRCRCCSSARCAPSSSRSWGARSIWWIWTALPPCCAGRWSATASCWRHGTGATSSISAPACRSNTSIFSRTSNARLTGFAVPWRNPGGPHQDAGGRGRACRAGRPVLQRHPGLRRKSSLIHLAPRRSTAPSGAGSGNTLLGGTISQALQERVRELL